MGNNLVVPTLEQQNAIDAFNSGDDLRINAFAGSGKTTTLQMIAEQTEKRGLYLAFNKSIAVDAGNRFPSHVSCSTVHSLAYRATPSGFKNGKKMTGRLNANALVQMMELKGWRANGLRIASRPQASLILNTVKRFLQSDRDTISLEDVARPGKLQTIDMTQFAALSEDTLRFANQLWLKMKDPADPTPLGHDGYLKLWAVSKPQLSADFVLMDEAQDTNPVVLGVLQQQKCQVIYVGDKHQQIYEWRGAVNAMALIDTPQQTNLTKSFRFGPEIAAAASKVLAMLGETEAIQGNSSLKSYLSADGCRAILARTNASVVSTVIEKLSQNYSVHVVGGVAEIVRMLRAVADLKRNIPSELPEFFGFLNWVEVVEYAKSEEGQELATFVNLVEQFGERRLIATLKSTVDNEQEADVIVSTAHKAKGREWKSVQLLDDFLQSKADKSDGDPEYDPAEVRLFYVAMTRCREAVDISPAVLSTFGIAKGQRRPGGPEVTPSRAPVARPVPPAIAPAQTAGNERSEAPSWWWIVLLTALAFYFLG